MTKELNFSKADIEYNNNTFYQRMEEMKGGNSKTWYGYLMQRNRKIYIGLKTEDYEKCWRWDMDIKDANERLHRCFKHFYCNLDDVKYHGFPDDMIKRCHKLAENAWYKDCGLGYRVKEQGR